MSSWFKAQWAIILQCQVGKEMNENPPAYIKSLECKFHLPLRLQAVTKQFYPLTTRHIFSYFPPPIQKAKFYFIFLVMSFGTYV